MLANDTSATQAPRLYPTRASAETAAIRALGGKLYRRAEYLPTTITGADGGPVFEVLPVPEGWQLVELEPREVHRRQQAGMRAEVASLVKQATELEERATQLNPSRNAHVEFLRAARELRAMAREIEGRIVVSVKAVA